MKRKPVTKCLLIVFFSVILITGFCVPTFATAVPVYSYDETDLVFNGGTSFSLNCTIYDPTYLCCWYYRNSNNGNNYYKANQSTFTSTANVNDVILRFGLAGFSTNSRDNLTSGQLPVGTVVRFDFAIRSYMNGQSYEIPQVRHYNGTSTTSWLYPDGYTSSVYVTSQEIFYFTYDFTISALNSYLGSEFHWSSYTQTGSTCRIDNVNISYTFPIADADYCLEKNIITQEQYDVIQSYLNPSGGSGTDIAPWLQGDTNEYPDVTPDTLPPEVEDYDTIFVPEDIDDSQIQSYLDRLDIGSWFRDFWAKMNSINIYLILIVIVLVLIFIRTLFMNFTNFIPK